MVTGLCPRLCSFSSKDPYFVPQTKQWGWKRGCRSWGCTQRAPGLSKPSSVIWQTFPSPAPAVGSPAGPGEPWWPPALSRLDERFASFSIFWLIMSGLHQEVVPSVLAFGLWMAEVPAVTKRRVGGWGETLIHKVHHTISNNCLAHTANCPLKANHAAINRVGKPGVQPCPCPGVLRCHRLSNVHVVLITTEEYFMCCKLNISRVHKISIGLTVRDIHLKERRGSRRTKYVMNNVLSSSSCSPWFTFSTSEQPVVFNGDN